MTELVVRRLLVDLEEPIPARWNGGDAFRSAFFNALSMSFPVGEQFFIDSVREGLKTLAPERREALAAEVQGFIGQEATHRRLHALFNGHLRELGFVNEIEARSLRRIKANAHFEPRIQVAATAATEHFTAIFAEWVLAHPEAFEGAQARLQNLWLWHASEESEHRDTAFDLYLAMGGTHRMRIAIFRYVTVIFLWDVTRQTIRNLWHDRSLFRWSSWRSAGRLLFSRDGMIRGNFGAWKAYFARDFHPSQQESTLAGDWLKSNSNLFNVVGRPADTAAS